MNCIIVDDEPLARQEMKALIEDVSELEIAGQFSNADIALDFIKGNKVDLIFLDIEMPMVTGLEFAAQISRDTLVIFTTAHAQYALESYGLDAIDYILKPVEKKRLEKAIAKARVYHTLLSDPAQKATLQSNTADYLLVKAERRFFRIFFADIRYIEGLKDYVVIHMANQKVITAMNLKTIHKKIPQDQFLRVSKSYVANLKLIDSFDHHTIYLGDQEIPLGDVYKKEFFRIYCQDGLNLDS